MKISKQKRKRKIITDPVMLAIISKYGKKEHGNFFATNSLTIKEYPWNAIDKAVYAGFKKDVVKFLLTQTISYFAAYGEPVVMIIGVETTEEKYIQKLWKIKIQNAWTKANSTPVVINYVNGDTTKSMKLKPEKVRNLKHQKENGQFSYSWDEPQHEPTAALSVDVTHGYQLVDIDLDFLEADSLETNEDL